MIGIDTSAGSVLIRRIVSYPSMVGSWISSKIRSGRSFATAASALQAWREQQEWLAEHHGGSVNTFKSRRRKRNASNPGDGRKTKRPNGLGRCKNSYGNRATSNFVTPSWTRFTGQPSVTNSFGMALCGQARLLCRGRSWIRC
jgi:hypothetical protein